MSVVKFAYIYVCTIRQSLFLQVFLMTVLFSPNKAAFHASEKQVSDHMRECSYINCPVCSSKFSSNSLEYTTQPVKVEDTQNTQTQQNMQKQHVSIICWSINAQYSTRLIQIQCTHSDVNTRLMHEPNVSALDEHQHQRLCVGFESFVEQY